VAVADQALETAVQTPVKAEQPIRLPPLLRPDWVVRFGSALPPVALDAGFWQAAVRGLNPRSAEQGGVALLARSHGVILLLAAVFPSQVRASTVHCEFSTADIDRVRRALDGVADEIDIADGGVKVTWVHTHPRLGVFLSGTDLETSRIWREFDPDFTPIVIDISKGNLEDQIGFFYPNGEKIQPMKVDGLISSAAAHRVRQEILRAYEQDGQAPPLVLISGSAG
jgi:hypothetical protein